jgi:cytoskeletal protein CcmA (bactofilin family)
VKGNIYSLDRVELLVTANVEGDISYGNVGIEVGATVLGKLNQLNAQDAVDAVELLISQAKQKTTAI